MKKSRQVLEILFENEDLVILNKPAGVLSIPDRFVPEKPNLVHQLEQKYEKAWIVHRLDKDTSGAICFALNAETHRDLSLQFQERSVEKYYWAILDGLLSKPSGTIDLGIAPHPVTKGKMIGSRRGKKATTEYKVLETFKYFSLVEAEIKTGRTHQIRVHFASLGHPLAVDELYGNRAALFFSEIKRKNFNKGKNEEERPFFQRLTLHAQRIAFTNPADGERIEVSAPLPKDFQALTRQLEKWLGK